MGKTASKRARFTLEDIKNCTARIVSISDPSPLYVIKKAGKKRRGGGGAKRGGTLTPHEILWAAIEQRWPSRAQKELEGSVPGRKYRIDIAFEPEKIAIEVDGWEWHGKHLGDFTRDRERQNLLTVHGWRILRFSAGMIRKDLDNQLEKIAAALRAGRGAEERSTA